MLNSKVNSLTIIARSSGRAQRLMKKPRSYQTVSGQMVPGMDQCDVYNKKAGFSKQWPGEQRIERRAILGFDCIRDYLDTKTNYAHGPDCRCSTSLPGPTSTGLDSLGSLVCV